MLNVHTALAASGLCDGRDGRRERNRISRVNASVAGTATEPGVKIACVLLVANVISPRTGPDGPCTVNEGVLTRRIHGLGERHDDTPPWTSFPPRSAAACGRHRRRRLVDADASDRDIDYRGGSDRARAIRHGARLRRIGWLRNHRDGVSRTR